MGNDAETKFRKLCSAKGFKVVKSTREQDMREHWDFLVNTSRVDVKAMKKLNRHDTKANPYIVYVEFRNVRGDNGWLYGEADWIALETEWGFVLVKRLDLVELAETKISSDFTNRPTVNKSYRRSDRPDEHVGLLNLGDVLQLPYKVIK